MPGRHEWRPYRQMAFAFILPRQLQVAMNGDPTDLSHTHVVRFTVFRRVRLQAHRFMTGTDLLRGRFHHRITGFMLRQVLLNNIKIQSQL